MTSTYNFTLTDNTPLTTVYALEGNGTGNLSTPRQILDINFESSDPYLVVADDVTNRFVNGFVFNIVGDSAYTGAFTVLGTPTTHVSPNGTLVTHIPLSAVPTVNGFPIVGVSVGASGYWVIRGPSNGQTQFNPTSIFTVVGNSLPAADMAYTVMNSHTGNDFIVTDVVTGINGTFTVAGDNTAYFNLTTTFNAVGMNGFDSVYTIQSVALVTGNTEITVAESIPPGTTITSNSKIILHTPNTVININGTIPVGAGTDGTAIAAPSDAFVFDANPVLITPTSPNNYQVMFRITGNHADQFVAESAFMVYKAYYNSTLYNHVYHVASASYNIGLDATEITINLSDPLPTTPVITVGINSRVLFPVPAVPYGYVQYNVTSVDTSLTLVGPGSARYNETTTWGKAFQDNLIHITENFKNTTAPVAPMDGQIWYDPSVPVMNVWTGTTWNAMVSTNWPAQGYVDMNDHSIVRLSDAVTTYPYVPSLTLAGNNDQEAMNLRTSDLLYIAKTGGSDSVAANRSGTMTGSLNINGASPVGHTTIGININNAPIHLYDASDILFKSGGSGNIIFEDTTTGNINIKGTGNVVVEQGNVTVGTLTNKVITQNNPGLAPTITFSTATTGNSVINLANNKITNLFTPSSALDAANKAYVDSLANGIIWIQPVKDPNLFADNLTAPPVLDNNIMYHKTYIVNGTGTGGWTGLDNRAVVYDPVQSTWVDILGRAVQIGDRFGVFCEPDDNDPLVSLPTGGLTGKAGKIVTVLSVSPYTYADYTPVEPDAFAVTGSNPTVNNLTNSYDASPHFGHSYTFRGTWAGTGFGTAFKWIEFSGPQMLVDGAGLRYTGNILNIGAAFGVTVNADTIQINQSDIDTVYLRRDGTVSMTSNLNLGNNRIINVADPAAPNDVVNRAYSDLTYVALAGSTMAASANITFISGGEVLGLPAIPSVSDAAASKTYVNNQDALKLSLTGGNMALNANITLQGTGEILGLPAIPSTGSAATSKTYVDTQLASVPLSGTVVHLAGAETITGNKTFSGTSLFSTVTIGGGSNIMFTGGAGEVLGLPSSPSVGSAATSKTYVDTQLGLKATDTAVVHLANPETITGAKTFSAASIMNGSLTLNNSLTLSANGSFTNLTANTTGLTVIGTTVGSGGAYSISLTAGQNTGGIGGVVSLTAGSGSTTGGAVSILSGLGSTTTGGDITITTGAGPTTVTSGKITLTAGNAALLLDPQGVWKINNIAPSAKNQSIVSNSASPASGVPSWQPIAHLVSAAPANTAAAGSPGDYFADDNFFYVYGATGWRRIAISTF